jgi:hypothetical protein
MVPLWMKYRRSISDNADRRMSKAINISTAVFMTFSMMFWLGSSALWADSALSKTKVTTKPRVTPKDALRPEVVIWENEKQKSRCELYLEDIRVIFYRTRYYCMQDNACECETYAKRFLDLVKKCADECPADYLAKNGYSHRLLQNVIWMKETRSCTDVIPQKTTPQ